MKIYVQLFLSIILVLLLVQVYCGIAPQTKIVQVKEEEGPGGIWKSKVQWKAHWVKHWEIRKIWVPIWRKVWGPVELKEWIPLPKPPPTWSPHPHSTVPY